MARTKATSYSPLVITGYILYSILVVSVILSTVIPWGQLLASPHVIRYNAILSLVALTVGALLPAAVGYLVGDETTKSKDKLSHHFNGVLFGLLAYWIMTIVSAFIILPYDLPQNARMIIINLLPSLCVLIISVPLAVAHVRSSQAKHDIMEYRPYGIALIVSIAFLLCMSLISSVHSNGLEWLSGVPFVVTLGIGALSYWTLRKSGLNACPKVNWSAISVSVAAVAAFAASLLCTSVSSYMNATSSMEYQAAVTIVGWALGVVGWAVYWWLQVRALSNNQAGA